MKRFLVMVTILLAVGAGLRAEEIGFIDYEHISIETDEEWEACCEIFIRYADEYTAILDAPYSPENAKRLTVAVMPTIASIVCAVETSQRFHNMAVKAGYSTSAELPVVIEMKSGFVQMSMAAMGYGMQAMSYRE